MRWRWQDAVISASRRWARPKSCVPPGSDAAHLPDGRVFCPGGARTGRIGYHTVRWPTPARLCGAAIAAASRAPRGFPVHLKLDTGATRLGITAPDLPAAIEIAQALPPSQGRRRMHPAGQRRRSGQPGHRRRNWPFSAKECELLRGGGFCAALSARGEFGRHRVARRRAFQHDPRGPGVVWASPGSRSARYCRIARRL